MDRMERAPGRHGGRRGARPGGSRQSQGLPEQPEHVVPPDEHDVGVG
jgi:hypothetical protein